MRVNLKNARKNIGLTQKQIAIKIGICERQYRKIEAGTSNGSIELWCRLKNLLTQISLPAGTGSRYKVIQIYFNKKN